MAEIASKAVPNLDELDFRVAAGLGTDNPLLRGVVALKSRCLVERDAYEDFSVAREADRLSQYLYHSTLVVALDSERAGYSPVASVMISDGIRNNVRKPVALSDILVSPDYTERDVLTGVMIALSCGRRERLNLRPVAATVDSADEHLASALSGLGFRKETPSALGDRYTIVAGQLAIHRSKRLPGGRAALKQARQSLRWI